MIKINLARQKKSSGGTRLDLKNFNAGQLFSSLGSILKMGGKDGASEKVFDLNAPIPKLIIALVTAMAIDNYLTEERQTALKAIDVQIAAVEKDRVAVQAKLSKIKGYEPIKKQLEEDEKAIRTKLEVVNKLLENRNAPSKMLMQLAQSIPEEVWLTEVTVTETTAKLAGAAPAENLISEFIKSLNGTSQFNDIGITQIQEAAGGEKKQRIQNFELNAKRRMVN